MPPPAYGSSGRGACGASSAPSCVVRSNGSPDRGAGRAGGLLTPRLRHEHAATGRSGAAGCWQPAPLADPRRVGGASAGVGGSPWACLRQGWAGGPKEPPARGGGADPREVVDGAGGHRVDQIARVVLRVDSRVAAVSGLSRGRRFSRRCASGTAGRSHVDVLSPSGADGTSGLGTGGTPGDRAPARKLPAHRARRPAARDRHPRYRDTLRPVPALEPTTSTHITVTFLQLGQRRTTVTALGAVSSDIRN